MICLGKGEVFVRVQRFGNRLGNCQRTGICKGKGIVLKEPSVISIDKNTGEILAVGEEARSMLGRTPATSWPKPVGSNFRYEITEKMLKYFLNKAVGKRMFGKPRVVICVPSGVTEVEKRAVLDAAAEAGAGRIFLIEEPIAAAIGAGLDISKARGNMVVDVGGGTTDVAVISLGGAVLSETIRIAGNDFDEAIIKYMRRSITC